MVLKDNDLHFISGHFPLHGMQFCNVCEDDISLGEIKQDMVQKPVALELENENADIYLFTIKFMKESDTEG